MNAARQVANAAGGTKPPSITTLFVDRMKREGRFEEWQEGLAKVQAETGQKFSQARWAAMRACGYTSPEEERRLQMLWRAKEEAKSEAAATAESEKKEDENSAFEAALAKLPAKGDRQTELDWIMSHVALTRRARGADKSAPVLITADDILSAAHGPAPSRAAAIRLQLFVDDPEELSKAMTFAVKRDEREDSTRNDSYIEDPGLDEVKRLLEAVRADSREERVAEAIELLEEAGYVLAKKPDAVSPSPAA